MATKVLTKGKIKWFNNQKGYGFVNPDGEEARDVFVHYSAIQGDGYKTVTNGQDVEFELIQGPKGDMAQNVVKL
jgi:CspA family cold shock protein